MPLFEDQIGNKINLTTVPKRIVSLVPSLTELLVDLGLEDLIKGVTKFCVHPEEIRKQKQVVGGTKNVKLDVVQALKPDFILANKEENTKETVEELQKVAPVYVSDINTIKDLKALIVALGRIFTVEKKATLLHSEIIQSQIDFTTSIQHRKEQTVWYFIWKDPWMLAGTETYINELLALNKFKNFTNQKRYPIIAFDNFEAQNTPDVILLSSEPYPFQQSHIDDLKKKFPNSEIKLVNGEYFSWYSFSSLNNGFEYFKQL